MKIQSKKKIVLLGMMSKMPVAGVVWQTIHYLLGFKRLGYDVYYVEAHGTTPRTFFRHEDDNGWAKAATFIASVMQRFDLSDHWAYHALYGDGHYYGLSECQLKELYGSAVLLINLHGGTIPLPEHSATGRLVYLETDPVELQIELHNNLKETIEFLEPHCAFFTFGENYGNADCLLPVSERFKFKPTRQPVVIDFWKPHSNGAGPRFTTIGNWQQPWRDVWFEGEVYRWSKHFEFMKFLDLPLRTNQEFELALSGCEETDRVMLESKGWRVRDALSFSVNLDEYRRYITSSRGEFTVAKDQNVRLRSGWFSDRSATYLASGRPVITQETGFSNVLPTGEGLFGFLTIEEAERAVEEISSDYERHCRSAHNIAREYFNYDVVLKALLDNVGLESPQPAQVRNKQAEVHEAFPPSLALTPLSRWPTILPEEIVRTVLERPLPHAFTRKAIAPSLSEHKRASIVIVTHNNLVFSRMCIESVLVNTDYEDFEVIVVDNGSTDGTNDYLRQMTSFWANLRVIFNDCNRGFAAANNQGLAAATGDLLVLLNNDTIVSRNWLARLAAHLEASAIGLVGPVTNRAGNEAQINVSYRTYGEMQEFAQSHIVLRKCESFDIRTATMFCVAMRRDTYERVGPLDEQFEVGLFEDDDYSVRARAAGYRVVCAENVFVHHFGQASISKLAATGDYGKLFELNRKRFELKWGVFWEPHRRRASQQYIQLVNRIQEVVRENLPRESLVIVVNKGDDDLLNLNGRRAWHFPQNEDGSYTGYYPSNSREAIEQLEDLRAKGGEFLLFPGTALWWLEHYTEFREHLERHYSLVARQEGVCLIYALQ